MAGAQKKKHIVLLSDEPVSTAKSGAFFGYAPLTSNVTYTPNQFFDVCIPHCSSPCVKLVGYMLRRHFGWVDAYGKPQEEQLVIGYTDLQSAGVPRGHIREALDEAIDRGFINCVRNPRRAEKGKSPISGLYELRFDDSPDYIKNPDAFNGFFDGDGHFTYVPNQFYDVCLREEIFSVIKAVGTVIRFSIGFKVRRGGGRRQLAKVALSFIQNYSNMSRPSAVSALKKAVEHNHLVRFQQGIFSPNKATQMAASYGLKWTDKEPIDYTFKTIGEKAAPKFNQKGDPETLPEGFGELPRNLTRSSTEALPEKLPRNLTKERKHTNKTLKQQQGQRVAVDRELLSLLQEQGLSKKDATALAEAYPEKLIRRQVDWLPTRNPRNPAGMLRRAIEEEWTAPIKPKSQSSDIGQSEAFAAAYYAGFAGNKDAPTAQPSGKEIESATAYVDRILKMWPEANLIENHGRAFGAYVRVKKPTTKDFRTTFTTALRHFGDEFYKDLNHQRVAEVRNHTDAQKKAHRKKHIQAYRTFVEAEEARIQRSEKARYSEFLEDRTKHRATIESGRFIRSSDNKKEMLASHDSDRARLHDFLNFFENKVADFWTWDTEQNPEAFGKVAP